MLHSRLHNGSMAEMILEQWQKVFSNPGRGSFHDAQFPGFTTMGSPAIFDAKPVQPRMQMDAHMGNVAAVQEMLVHVRRGVIQFFPGVPQGWPDCSFRNFRLPGGVVARGEYHNGKPVSIGVTATRSVTIRIESPWTGEVTEHSLRPGKALTVVADAGTGGSAS